MEIYLLIVALSLILGLAMPQEGPKRKYYILVMALLHGFVCGFRYQFLTGDLMKYQWTYAHMYEHGWFSEVVWQGGRNAGFNLLMKGCAIIFSNQFQPFLVLTAALISIAVAVIVYRYSPAPWMSYLMWNCMAFYIFGFSALKQAVAMAVIMFAFVAAMERKPIWYIISMAAAGLIHTPSLIFLPVYFLVNKRVTGKTIAFYGILALAFYIFRNQIVDFITSIYYEEDSIELMTQEGVGNRFIMVLLFTIFGILFRGFQDREFGTLFHIMMIAAMLQMLSGFNNVFTRLTDYYFQFSILYVPMIFFGGRRDHAVFLFDEWSLKVMAGIITLFVLWFYWKYNLNIDIGYATDNYLNFRFMWDVR